MISMKIFNTHIMNIFWNYICKYRNNTYATYRHYWNYLIVISRINIYFISTKGFHFYDLTYITTCLLYGSYIL